MKEYIEIYNNNKEKIESILEGSIESLKLSNEAENYYQKLFATFPSLEVVYTVDAVSKIQTSANIYSKYNDDSQRDKSRSYLINKLEIKENNFAFTAPYQSATTGTLCVTVSKKEGNKIIFMDFVLEKLLERLGLIEKHIYFSKVIKAFYLIAGFFMMILSTAAIIYGGFDFLKNIFHESLNIDAIFKPVIATTLGLAIFDLAKTILEQEVFFKSYSKDSKIEIKVLTKFLITILIALSIETLMVVFKIAIENYDKMVNALYLMGGISFIITALAVLIFLTRRRAV
ncbi:PDC sensor domain-containing protein [Sulfurimonas sp. HSL-1716]|uniref:PDC sensor domain-containing protein n=1 Tax=Hydrocurvibacter sulfurireducens TaxID=3131937 RepID=UPI0031F9311A